MARGARSDLVVPLGLTPISMHVAVFAYDSALYDNLVQQLTARRFKEHYAGLNART